MKNIKWLLLAVLGTGLSACSTFTPDTNPDKTERVGVLLAQNCEGQADCDSFSLLDKDMATQIAALGGKLNRSLNGRLIAVLGKGQVGANGLERISVEQTHAITQFDYQPFLNDAVARYVQQQYACISYWDQSYAWRLQDRQPILIASLSNPFDPDAGRITLEFDGLSKAMLSARAVPQTANPCQLR